MKTAEILIIGGGAAGTTAAETYRAGGGTGSVAIVTDERHPSYSRVLLPHAAKGRIAPDKVFLKTPQWYADKGIELMGGRTAVRVSFKHKIVTLDGKEEIGFDKLVIAVGGKPRDWGMPGATDRNVLRLQTYEDARALHEALVPGRRMAIIGSGFIAIEFAAACLEKGVKAMLLNRGPHFWASAVGEGIAADVQAALEAKGIEVRNGLKATGFEDAGTHHRLTLSDESGVICDLVGLGLGIETDMAPFGDLRGEHGLSADGTLKAKHHDVWIAGDCCEYDDEVTGLRHVAGNWANAVAQGRHVGKALLGEDEPFAILTSYSTSVFPGVNLIFVGGTRNIPGMTRHERLIAPGKRIEFRVVGGRVVGAALLNATDQRAACATLIIAKIPVGGREALLSDPTVPLDAF